MWIDNEGDVQLRISVIRYRRSPYLAVETQLRTLTGHATHLHMMRGLLFFLLLASIAACRGQLSHGGRSNLFTALKPYLPEESDAEYLSLFKRMIIQGRGKEAVPDSHRVSHFSNLRVSIRCSGEARDEIDQDTFYPLNNDSPDDSVSEAIDPSASPTAPHFSQQAQGKTAGLLA